MSDTSQSAETAETTGAVQSSSAVVQPEKATNRTSEEDSSVETAKTDNKKNEKKWGRAAMSAGYTIIPDVLLKAQRALGLDSLDLNILLHLVKHWWEAERAPYLGKSSIAELIGVDESTVRRRIFALEQAGLLKRVRRSDPTKGDQTNAIDLSPLVKKLEPHAEMALELKQERKQHKALRDKRIKKTASKTQPAGD